MQTYVMFTYPTVFPLKNLFSLVLLFPQGFWLCTCICFAVPLNNANVGNPSLNTRKLSLLFTLSFSQRSIVSKLEKSVVLMSFLSGQTSCWSSTPSPSMSLRHLSPDYQKKHYWVEIQRMCPLDSELVFVCSGL